MCGWLGVAVPASANVRVSTSAVAQPPHGAIGSGAPPAKR